MGADQLPHHVYYHPNLALVYVSPVSVVIPQRTPNFVMVKVNAISSHRNRNVMPVTNPRGVRVNPAIVVVAANRLSSSLERVSIPSVTERYHLFLRNLHRRSTWLSALGVLLVVLRNAAGSILCAWLTNACYALGNVFCGKTSSHQSRGELVVANICWCAVTYCTALLVSQLPPMLSLHFLRSPDRRPTAWFCLKKLARGALRYFIASLTIMLVVGSLVARLYTAVTDTVKYKLEFYIASVSTHMYTTGITLVAKRIYYRETCEGRDHRSSELQKQKSSFTAASRASIKVAPLPSPADYRSPKFWPAYVRGSPKLIPALVAGAYVHILSQQRIIERGSTVLTCFIIVSTLFKLAIQEGARHYVLKKKVRSIRFMCVLVGLPTVLIDTQTRIILLGTQNTQLAALGTLGMALVEICLRGGKALFVTWSIRRREVAVQRQIPARQRQVAQQQVDANADPSSVCTSRPSISVMRLDFELWRRQLQAFHTAELNADMYAEYIAIGCSASILFFYGTHPYYSMLRVSQSSEAEAAATRVNQLYMLIFQFVVEVAVDYVSIVLEMTAGIEFEHTKDLGAFLAALFMVTAVLNINISATIYLS